MASAEQRRQLRQARATARQMAQARRSRKSSPKILPKTVRERIKATEREYVRSVADGSEPYPNPNTPEAKQLARYASLARHGKADPAFYDMFKQYFYHDEKKQQPDEEYEEYPESEEDDDEE